jgi:tight adherence protein C
MTLVDMLIQLMVFGSAAITTLALVRQTEVWLTVRGRLGSTASAGLAPVLVKGGKVESPVLRWIKARTLDQSKEESALRRDLANAGFDSPAAPIWYVIIRLGAAVGLPLLYLLLQSLSGNASGSGAIFLPLVSCVVGFFGPQFYLRQKTNDRRTELMSQFPDTLDLLVICIEAGMGLEAAFVRVGEETQGSHPRLAKEIVRMSQEIGAGRSRGDALRALAERTDVDMIRSFAGVIIQSDALGASMGQTLRTFSHEMRETRYLQAEEKAMRIPVLMTIPLVACILPVIVTALLLPAVIDVIRTVAPALHGGAG